MENKIRSGKEILEAVELSAKAAAVVLSIFYVLGLIVVNLYLSTFGFASFSYARPQYIFTGFWVMLVFCLTLLPVGVASWLLTGRGHVFGAVFKSRTAFKAHFVSSLVSLIVLVAGLTLAPVLWYWGLSVSANPQDLPPQFSAYFILFVCGMGYMPVYWGLRALSSRNKQSTLVIEEADSGSLDSRTIVVLVAFPLIAILLAVAVLFSNSIFLKIKPAFGGGEPLRARVMVEPSSVSDLVRIGLPLRRDRNVTLPVDILANTEDELFLEAGTRRFMLPRSQVKGMSLKPSGLTFLWELQDFYELSAVPDGLRGNPTCAKTFTDNFDRTLKTFDIPLHSSSAWDWQCRTSCYAAVEELESSRRDEEETCTLLSKAKPAK